MIWRDVRECCARVLVQGMPAVLAGAVLVSGCSSPEGRSGTAPDTNPERFARLILARLTLNQTYEQFGDAVDQYSKLFEEFGTSNREATEVNGARRAFQRVRVLSLEDFMGLHLAREAPSLTAAIEQLRIAREAAIALMESALDLLLGVPNLDVDVEVLIEQERDVRSKLLAVIDNFVKPIAEIEIRICEVERYLYERAEGSPPDAFCARLPSP